MKLTSNSWKRYAKIKQQASRLKFHGTPCMMLAIMCSIASSENIQDNKFIPTHHRHQFCGISYISGGEKFCWTRRFCARMCSTHGRARWSFRKNEMRTQKSWNSSSKARRPRRLFYLKMFSFLLIFRNVFFVDLLCFMSFFFGMKKKESKEIEFNKRKNRVQLFARMCNWRFLARNLLRQVLFVITWMLQ